MILLEISSFEFVQFLKIVMWVCVPLMIVSMLVVTYWHYRNKRKAALSENTNEGNERLNELLRSAVLSAKKKKEDPLFKNYKHILNTSEKSMALDHELGTTSKFYSS